VEVTERTQWRWGTHLEGRRGGESHQDGWPRWGTGGDGRWRRWSSVVPWGVEGKALSGAVNVRHQTERLGRAVVCLPVEISDERRLWLTLGKWNKL
jgi:hypothetical protein